jgi:hypothetical protein
MGTNPFSSLSVWGLASTVGSIALEDGGFAIPPEFDWLGNLP